MTENLYKDILLKLEYEGHTNFREGKGNSYNFDACFFISAGKEFYPVVGIKKFTNTEEVLIEKAHRYFWNQNTVPISIFIFPNEYRIYNNFTREKKQLSGGDSAGLNSEWLNNLKASQIVKSVVLDKILKLSKPNERVDYQLLASLEYAVKKVYQECHMPLEQAYEFMSQCIFIKYMEDRQILTENCFRRWRVSSFAELLNLKNLDILFQLFEFLKKQFNGDLFVMDRRRMPTIEQLEVFSRFFNAEEYLPDGNTQLRLFPFDFSVIPISLISNIYEKFFAMEDKLEKKQNASSAGAYYTPSDLAEFIINGCLLKSEKKYPKILDGSVTKMIRFLDGSLSVKVMGCKPFFYFRKQGCA